LQELVGGTKQNSKNTHGCALLNRTATQDEFELRPEAGTAPETSIVRRVPKDRQAECLHTIPVFARTIWSAK
jgi:hypothetical protein